MGIKKLRLCKRSNEATKEVTRWYYSLMQPYSSTPTIQYDDLQGLKIKELLVRKELAYAGFDVIFGRMQKPDRGPAKISRTVDCGPANLLAREVYDLHPDLPTTNTSKPLVVKQDGSIVNVDGVSFDTEIKLDSKFMTGLRKETTAFLAQILGAQKLVSNTFNTKALTGFATVEEAQASLTTAPVTTKE